MIVAAVSEKADLRIHCDVASGHAAQLGNEFAFADSERNVEFSRKPHVDGDFGEQLLDRFEPDRSEHLLLVVRCGGSVRHGRMLPTEVPGDVSRAVPGRRRPTATSRPGRAWSC